MTSMAAINWTPIDTLSLRDEKVFWPWRVAVATLRDVTHLRISATGLWEPADGQLAPFSPDGHMGLRVDASLLLLPDVPVGALLGRIGGSSASLTTVPSAATDALAASQVFPIGAHCIVGVGTALVGPLFIGFNWRSRPLQVKELTVSVEGAAPL
jgi:hypothetical protein